MHVVPARIFQHDQDWQQQKKLLIAALQECAGLQEGRQLHARISQCHILRRDQLLLNLLIKMYSDYGRMDLAQYIFKEMPRRNVFSWNIMLVAYAQNGHLEQAEVLFDKMPLRDAVSWNSMIQAQARAGNGDRAFRLFVLMDLDGVKPDRFAIAPVLSCCSSLAMADLMHAVARDGGSDVGCQHVANELMKMYGRLGRPRQAQEIFDALRDDARDVVAAATMITALADNGNLPLALNLFHGTPHRNTTIWNAIVSACNRNGRSKHAILLLCAMDLEGDTSSADAITFVSAIEACSSLEEVKSVYESAVQGGNDAFQAMEVKTALVDCYGKHSGVLEARIIFDSIDNRDVVAWTAMITTYARNGHRNSALQIFQRMQHEGVEPNTVTLSSVFHACAAAASLSDTRKIHSSISGLSIELDTVVSNSLMDAYRSCGALQSVAGVFKQMPVRNVVSWSSMVAGYAQCGYSSESLAVFQEMDLEGMAPNEVTFVSIISACSHGGLLEDGRLYFVRMFQDYGIQPGMDHFACLADLLGRTGKVEEAKEIAASHSLDLSDLRIIQHS
ncbi:pentatricopeptide repeat-containing protein At4g02750-like [Selaginella moellendorffii]|uniref:pentatricopeptide repeat-containing protein At4g02750-like n=1 Tax=Selaginella moellendorffii TaxID=88036 RepID=UPI000D1C8BD5|nr:pentatricopeptide repeat-containing protein At4g02750-like [Selaginella moellendorffii]|eukprot:XP_024545543.1 pentatricopeptide repeat-containing protein At4g02750-like [Selaginella moellendorffii]